MLYKGSERYAEIIQTALDIQQKQIELSRLYNKLSGLLTVKELKAKNFDEDAANGAFKLLPVTIEPAKYVKGKLTYKDVEVSLHEAPGSLGAKAMKQCFEDVSTQKLLKD